MSGLALDDVVTGYARPDVLHGVTLRVKPGEAVAVLGANGAGKSTLMRVIAGHVRVRSGTVTFDGATLRRPSPSARVRKGVVLVAEGHEVVGTLTVGENLALGAFRYWPLRSRRAVAEALDQVFEIFPILAERRHQMAGLLSGGQQQMLAIGRALMAQPTLLLLDEPSLGLAPVVVDQIYERLAELKRSQLSMLIVEQNSDRVADLCDRAYVLRLGDIVAENSEGAFSDEALRRAYFGT